MGAGRWGRLRTWAGGGDVLRGYRVEPSPGGADSLHPIGTKITSRSSWVILQRPARVSHHRNVGVVSGLARLSERTGRAGGPRACEDSSAARATDRGTTPSAQVFRRKDGRARPVGERGSAELKNPHNSPHYGRDADCNLCHHQHAKSENYCAQYHEKWAFKVP
ncbi:MAG TPA: cytochrome c3 family protein [Burkholderiales bacterium]|nr:cytochrome c3 family protein [Burkholderiales bacterium]